MTITRLAEIGAELARLRGEHDLAMSAFLFDEAAGLQCRTAALEAERRALAEALPAAPAEPEPVTGTVPTLLRPRRPVRRPRR